MPEKTVFLKGEEFDKTGISISAYLSNNSSWPVDASKWTSDFSSSEICWQGKTVTASYTIGGVTKTADINATYYVAESDALTQSPVKLPDYTGTLEGGTYYKFGDFPQTIASHQEDSYYTSDTVRNGWYLGQDGYFYEKCKADPYTEDSVYTCSDNTVLSKWKIYYFRVEPIVWRALTTTFDHDADGTGDKILLLAESILTANAYYGNFYIKEARTLNGSTIYHSNYKYSNIRAYLNGTANQFVTDGGAATEHDIDWTGKGFIDVAFTSTAQDLIATTIVDNSAESTTNAGNNLKQATTYACDNTEDKIFLLSEKEVTTSDYGFTEYNVYGLSLIHI